jgi:hypothetical protein
LAELRKRLLRAAETFELFFPRRNDIHPAAAASMNWLRHFLPAAATILIAALPILAATPAITLEVDAQRDIKPISRYIYGINQFHGFNDGLTGQYSNCTFTRLGGNRFTAYNWTNNASNAGTDLNCENDDYLVSGDMFKGIQDTPGGALMPALDAANQHGAGILLTIPITGYVAADKTPAGDVRKSADYLHRRFKPSRPTKNGPFYLWPDPNAPAVYQDEFVNWVKTKYSYTLSDINRPIWFCLDNEPDWWSKTHPEIHPDPVTYQEVADDNIAYATAVKDVMDSTLIFGPSNYGWYGYIRLQGASDARNRDFQEYYLQRMAAAQKAQGRRLLDVLDVHWYPEATGGGIRVSEPRARGSAVSAARVLAPRSLWDPTYTENSWITDKSTAGPIALIPRLQQKIDQFYPGTKLSFSEYNYGGGADVSGGIAEADVLGIFGREGVFAAAVWPDITPMPFIGGAMEMYRNFDGKNGAFGDVSIRAMSGDNSKCSIYASLDSRVNGRMVVVLINKTRHPLSGQILLHNADDFTRAQIYQLTSKNHDPMPAGAIQIDASHQLTCTMPGFSVSTLLITQEAP